MSSDTAHPTTGEHIAGMDAGLLAAVVAVADGLELEETLQRIVDAALALVDANYGALGVFGQDGRLSRFIHVGVPDAVAERIGRLPEGRGVIGLLSNRTTPLRLGDVTTHKSAAGFPAGHPKMQSFLGVPILVRGSVYGHLFLTNKRAGEFTVDDEELLVALAAVAGVAIRNAGLFMRIRRRQQWQRAVTSIDTMVLAGAADDEVAGEVASAAVELGSAAVARVALPDPTGELRWVGAASGRGPEGHADRAGTLAASRGGAVASESPVVAAYRNGQRRVLAQWPTGDVADYLRGPALALPLRARAEILGVLELRRRAGAAEFDDELVELAEAFCDQTAVALSFGSERRERERLAVFEERDRIARDLHDLVIQRLFATGMMLEGAARIAATPPVLAERIGKAVDELDETIKEIRTTIFELHDPSGGPSWVGVRARVLAEVERAASGEAPKAAVTFAGPVDALVDSELAGHLVAAVREGLSNAVRHSGGRTFGVQVSADSSALRLRVVDDGRGLGGAEPPRFSGLANLRRRAAALGGGAGLAERADGPGAELSWWVPMPQ